MEASLLQDQPSVLLAQRDSMQATIILIVCSARLGTLVVEDYDYSVISGLFLLLALDIVLLAVVDTSVTVINGCFALQVPSAMDLLLAALLVRQEPSAQEKVTRLRILVMTVSIPLVTPLHAMSAKKVSCVRRELKEIVQLGKLAVGVTS